MIEDCAALILAGGDSRRMGQDKAKMMLEGKSLLENVLRTMQQIFPEVIVSVRELRSGVEVQQVCDETPGNGPLAGLIAGMSKLDAPWVFAVACDMPFMTNAVVTRLASCRGGYQAVVPLIAGYAQPLAAFYARSALEVMHEALEAGDRSLREVLQRLNVRYVSEAELRDTDPQLRSFFDLDTPQDYLAAQGK